MITDVSSVIKGFGNKNQPIVDIEVSELPNGVLGIDVSIANSKKEKDMLDSDGGSIAVGIYNRVSGGNKKVNDDAFFVAGFQSCIQYLKEQGLLNVGDRLNQNSNSEILKMVKDVIAQCKNQVYTESKITERKEPISTEDGIDEWRIVERIEVQTHKTIAPNMKDVKNSLKLLPKLIKKMK